MQHTARYPIILMDRRFRFRLQMHGAAYTAKVIPPQRGHLGKLGCPDKSGQFRFMQPWLIPSISE
jgi:hypothetical protein